MCVVGNILTEMYILTHKDKIVPTEHKINIGLQCSVVCRVATLQSLPTSCCGGPDSFPGYAVSDEWLNK